MGDNQNEYDAGPLSPVEKKTNKKLIIVGAATVIIICIALGMIVYHFLATEQEASGSIVAPDKQKSIGLGMGPSFIGGNDTDAEGNELSLRIYEQFINFKRLTGQLKANDENYYSSWVDQDKCIGHCPTSSSCKKAVCSCNLHESVVQIYGQCSNKTANIVGDDAKFRKPKPPARPQWCFCDKKIGGKEVCSQHRGREECQVVTYPNNFDHNSQFCKRGNHTFCLGKDINMFCGTRTIQDPTDGINKHLCECRKDMKFDPRNMECRLYIDVDCTFETKEGYDTNGNLAKVLTQGAEPEKEYSTKEINKAFCNVIGREAEK